MKKVYSRKELLKDGMFSIRSNIRMMEECALKGNHEMKKNFYMRATARACMLCDLRLISFDKLELLLHIIDGKFLIAGFEHIKKRRE